MMTNQDKIEFLKNELTKIQNEINTIQSFIKYRYLKVEAFKKQRTENDMKDGAKNISKSLGLNIVVKEEEIKILESIASRLKNEEWQMLEKLIISSWYEKIKQVIKTKKMNGEFYSEDDSEVIINYDKGWDEVEGMADGLRIEEHLSQTKQFSGISEMDFEIDRLKERIYRKTNLDIIELEILNKKKEWFIKGKNVKKLYDLLDEKMRQDVVYIIKKGEWDKIDL